MARKPESTFIKNVHDKLQAAYPEVYPEKTHNPFRGGIPDVWYDSPAGDMWVEYKWLPKVPSSIDLTGGDRPWLSPLQARWLDRAACNGRTVAVVVGFKMDNQTHGIITTDWHRTHHITSFPAYDTKGLALVLAEMMGIQREPDT